MSILVLIMSAMHRLKGGGERTFLWGPLFWHCVDYVTEGRIHLLVSFVLHLFIKFVNKFMCISTMSNALLTSSAAVFVRSDVAGLLQ